MVSQKKWIIINISLGLMIILLVLNLLEITSPALGKAVDQEDAFCFVQWGDEFTSWDDLNHCCLEARKQLTCSEETRVQEGIGLDWVCQTGSGKVLKYWLTEQAFNYCRQQVIWR